ncbi:hypothetical protein B484DRAFT_476576 [Ochromonadaceae sp. CCMP2298]|nr:hypothetical protein B484DRAFT_476576 [Ochromonadaceae sp. CCMP2298]
MESVLEISAHKYGNYHKYYTFHPSSARSNFFADDEIYLTLWRAQGQPQLFSLLDVGCNEGNLSVDLLLQARKALPGVTVTLLGLDLDSHLIGLAQKKYQGWGQEQEQKQEQEQEQEQEQKRQQEQGQQQEHRLQGVEFLAIDFMDEAATAAVCATHLRRMRAFITMWIHLNHADTGLVTFLESSAALVSPLGSLIVEPQPWRCYKSADKRCRKLGICRPVHLCDLEIRGEIEPEIVRIVMGLGDGGGGVGMGGVMRSYWDMGKEGWGRSIFVFHKAEVPLHRKVAQVDGKGDLQVQAVGPHGADKVATSDKRAEESCTPTAHPGAQPDCNNQQQQQQQQSEEDGSASKRAKVL